MILRRIGIGNEDRGHPPCREFRQPRRPCTKDGNVRHRHRLRHIVEIRHNAQMRILRYIDARSANARARVLVLLRARDVEVLHLCLLRRATDHLDHGTVDRTRSTTATRDEHRLFRRIKVKRRRALRPRRREHLGADGVARDVGLFRWKDAPRILHPDGDRRRKTGEDAVRHPRHGVLLLHERRNPRETRCEENRPRDVAARPDGDIGMKAMHDAACPRNGTHGTPCPQHILEREMPLKAREIDGNKIQPLARHDVRL